jgi:hypothetical protein
MWPPTIPLADIADNTPQLTRHPDDHNKITEALRSLVARSAHIQHGVSVISTDGAGAARINFPESFTAAPTVTAMLQDPPAGFSIRCLTTVDASGFALSILYNGSPAPSGSGLGVHWSALGEDVV